MIRSLNRADLLSFLIFARHAPPNQAITRNSLGRRSLFSPEAILEHWFPLNGRRHTWVLEGDGRIDGAVSLKGGTSPTVWKIDCLQVSDEEQCVSLLETASAGASERGVRKLFLILDSSDPLVNGARRAGFASYNKDYLYRYSGKRVYHTSAAPGLYHLRTRTTADDFGLFQLYNAAAPTPVRTAEGMTLEEWRESREYGSWLEQRQDFILEKQGRLVAWLHTNASRGGACFEIITHNLEVEGLEWLVRYALRYLDGKSPILCIVPAFQSQLSGILEDSGFEQVAEYIASVKEIAIKVKQPQFVPMRA
jgi:hypothetical protein